jgi:hypothetical protein
MLRSSAVNWTRLSTKQRFKGGFSRVPLPLGFASMGDYVWTGAMTKREDRDSISPVNLDE